MSAGGPQPVPPSISVVITTYRRRDSLPEVVGAVTADPYPIEVVVVVDGCDDGSYQLLVRLAEEDARIRPVWRDNGGECAARATGVAHATGEVVLLLDDDVVAGPGLAYGHARAHANRTGTVVLGYMPTVRRAPRRPGDFATLLYAAEYERACARYEADPASIITGLWAGNMSLRRADALRVGLDGGRRLGYHDDQDFGLRCARAGLVAVFDRSLRASHSHHRDLAAFCRQAWLAGAARRRMSAEYPDLLAAADPGRQLSWPVRAVIAAAADPAGYRLCRPALRAGVRISGAVRAWPLETGAARLLRQVELVRGFRGRS